MHPAVAKPVLGPALAIAMALVGGCAGAPAQPVAAYAGEAAERQARLHRDRADCIAQAEQAVRDYRAHDRRPSLGNVSSLGVGVALFMAEARAVDQVRRQAFHDCMRAAGWQLQARLTRG